MFAETVWEDEVINLIKPFIKDIECYLVGGYLRDLACGEKSYDRDLIVKSECAKDLALKISNGVNGHFIVLDEVNKIYRVVMPDKINYFDISAMLDNDLDKDIKRRDLTINSMVFDLNNNNFIDKCGAYNDFNNKILKTFDLNNFNDDPLRILRVFRFAAKYNFNINKDIYSFIKKNGYLLAKPAKERINTELMKLFEAKYSHEALLKMNECGILSIIFPCTEEIKKIPPNTHHHLDLLGHSIETVRQIEINYEKLDDDKKLYLDDKSLGNYSRKAFLKLAGFLHDIGKPDTWTIEQPSGRHRFIMHDEVGAKKVVSILKELKFSKKQILYVQSMIKNHIYPSSLVWNESVGSKARLKYYRKMSPYFLDNIILAKSDRLSARGPAITDNVVNKNLSDLSDLLNECLEYEKKPLTPKPFLSGYEIMKITGLPQSKKLGEIVKSLYAAQLDGEILSKEEAEKFVLRYYNL